MTERKYKLYRWLFAKPFFTEWNRILFQMSIRGLGILNYENREVSGEHFFARQLKEILQNDSPVIFDVGADVGNYTKLMAGHFPNSRIFAFEPHPENFKRLKEYTGSGCKTYNLALGDKKGELQLYDRADSKGSSHASLFRAVISDIHLQEVVSYRIMCGTLDNFVKERNVKNIDLLKIDTEGNEYAVLEGASTLLNQDRVRCIHFEFNEMNVVSRRFLRDFRLKLKAFDFYRLLPKGLLRLNDLMLESELFAYQNIIALHK